MVDKLSITIALEGGKAIEQQLEGIGKAGQKAFEDIAKAAQQAGGFKNLKPEEVTAKLKDMGVAGEDAIHKITSAVQSATRLEQLVGVVQSVEAGFSSLASAAAMFGRALGPIGVVAIGVGTKVAGAMAEAATAINKLDTAAIQAGLSIEKFDKLNQTLRGAGISASAAAEGMGKLLGAIEQGKLDAVTKAFKELQDAAARGFGVQGTQQLKLLQDAAQGVGPAADAAREALKKLGETAIPDSPAQKLRDIVAASKDAVTAARNVIAALEKMPDSANRSAAAAELLGSKLGSEVVQGLRTGSLSAAEFDKVVNTISQSAANTAANVEQSTNKMGAAWERFKTTGDTSELGKIWTEFGKQASAAFSQMEGGFGIMNAKVAEFAASLGGAIWDTFAQAGSAAIEAVSGALDGLWQKIKAIGAAIAGIFGGGGAGGETTPAPGFASGGRIGGRGSGRSDSNLAWVSRGEHIMPAAAVRQPGVLALLEALRRSGGNLRGVLDGMGRFAAGGVVPRFAAGGLVGGMGHLGTVDLRTDHGSVRLMGGASAVEQLGRLAVTKRMTSTGRKPGFVG